MPVISNPRGRLFLVLLALFAIRILYAHFLGWHSIPPTSDAHSYNGYALAILGRPDWLTHPGFPGDFRPPVYPLFIALIYRIFGEGNLFAVFCAQSLISTLTVYYIYRLSAAFFGERKSFLVLIWAGIYYFYLFYVGMLLRETLIYFLIVVQFYHLKRFLDTRRERPAYSSVHLWVSVISFVLLIHTDARYLFYVPCLVILFVLFRGFRAGIRDYVVTAGLVVVLMIPWLIRNYVAYGGVVVVNTRTLDLTSSEGSMRLELLSTKRLTEVKKDPHWRANRNYPTEQERAAIKSGENPRGRPAYELRMIRKDEYPASSFIGRKLFYTLEMWRPFRFGYSYSPFPSATIVPPWSMKHNVASILFYGTLLPFAAFAVARMLHDRRKGVWFLLFPIVVQGVMHLLTFGLERYRTHIDAFLLILGCYGIVELAGRLRSRAHGDLPRRDAPAGAGPAGSA
jgi:hypothetical protein